MGTWSPKKKKKKTKVLPTWWTDDQGYRWVLGRKKPKSYLLGKRMTKDTDGYLVAKNPSPTYGLDR